MRLTRSILIACLCGCVAGVVGTLGIQRVAAGPYEVVECNLDVRARGGTGVVGCRKVSYPDKPKGWSQWAECGPNGKPASPRSTVCRP